MGKIMHPYVYVAVIVILIALIFRYWPVDSEPFHEDPALFDVRRSEVRLIAREAPRFNGEAFDVLEAFIKIATRDWGVSVAQGCVDEGMVTLVARSKLIGFRDYVTAKAVDEAGGTKLALLARPRMNVYDWGVNQKRLDRWLSQLEQTFPR